MRGAVLCCAYMEFIYSPMMVIHASISNDRSLADDIIMGIYGQSDIHVVYYTVCISCYAYRICKIAMNVCHGNAPLTYKVSLLIG